MSINYSSFGNLLSNTGTNALNNFYNGTYSQKNKYTGVYDSNLSILSGISTKNSYTNTYTGFATSSIFANSSGIAQNNSFISTCNCGSMETGSDGLNRRGALNIKSSAIPKTDNPYANGNYGASIVGNYFTSIQNVALGQYAPTSVFEQRLNYHLDYSDQKKPGSMLGVYTNYFDIDSVSNNANNVTGYNVFSSKTTQASTNIKAAGAKTVSELMSVLA